MVVVGRHWALSSALGRPRDGPAPSVSVGGPPTSARGAPLRGDRARDHILAKVLLDQVLEFRSFDELEPTMLAGKVVAGPAEPRCGDQDPLGSTLVLDHSGERLDGLNTHELAVALRLNDALTSMLSMSRYFDRSNSTMGRIGSRS